MPDDGDALDRLGDDAGDSADTWLDEQADEARARARAAVLDQLDADAARLGQTEWRW